MKISFNEDVVCLIAQYLFIYWINLFSAGNENLIIW